MRTAITAAILAYSNLAAGLTVDLGQFTLTHQQSAHIHVFNPGPGWMEVRLAFSDPAGTGKIIVEHSETLQSGHSTTLSLAGINVHAGTQVRAEVQSLAADLASTCRPDATLQITIKGSSLTSVNRGSIRQTALSAHEDAAMHALRVISRAQGLYYEGKRMRGEPPSYARSIEELEHAGILPKGYGRDLEAGGYSFKFAIALLTYSVIVQGINRTGDRAFFVDESGVIRASGPCSDPPSAGAGPLNN